ncbi:hypothetical protein DFH07DRAFT_708117, partial [Mycena maculata]
YTDSATSLPPPAKTTPRRTSNFCLMLHAALLSTLFFLLQFIPRQAYLNLLLRIPSLYFSRVARIFEDARISLPDIKQM